MNNMNLPSIKSFGKYGLESIAIIVSVLFSFYLEDLRVTNEKTNYKNELVKNLKAIINEDLINIQNIKELQNRAYAGADLIINDMMDGKMDLDKKEIAANYLLVRQRGWVSFFPQNGSYTELISTGSLELIRSTNFRKALTNTYTHLYERNLQVSRTIDDFFLDAFTRYSPYIIIQSTEKKNEGFVYSELVPTKYIIDENYYLSNQAISDMTQFKNLIGMYLDLLDEYEKSYNMLKLHSDEEVN